MARCATGVISGAIEELSLAAGGLIRMVETFLGCAETMFCSSLGATRSELFANAGSENSRGIAFEMLAARLEFMPGPESQYVPASASMSRKAAAIATLGPLTNRRAAARRGCANTFRPGPAVRIYPTRPISSTEAVLARAAL